MWEKAGMIMSTDSIFFMVSLNITFKLFNLFLADEEAKLKRELGEI